MSRSPATPYLVVDAERLDANIVRAAEWAAQRGVVLRPHAKTHKIPEIARRQLAAGAIGLTVATVAEAEVFADAGFADLFIAYPLWLDEPRRRRVAALGEHLRLHVGCDSEEAGRRLPPAARVLIEVDSGHHRSGVAPTATGDLAARLRALGLVVDGVFTFPGHSYTPGSRAGAAGQEELALIEAADGLRAVGVDPMIVSGGSTPSLAFSGTAATEYRPGVYVFNDAQQWELGSCAPDDIALTCHATVVSHAGGRVILDAGSKVLGADRPAWTSGYGRLLDDPDARITMLSEHHAVVETGTRPALGSIVRVVPNHACNAVNLVDRVWVRGLAEPTWWTVAARGAND